jgi:hypothetical protein
VSESIREGASKVIIARFDTEDRREITAFGSKHVRLSPILRLNGCEGRLQAALFQIGPLGRIGRHQATISQLLLVLEGEAYVSGDNGAEVPIHKGEGVFWAAGEEHETRTESGITAMVFEAETVDLMQYLSKHQN